MNEVIWIRLGDDDGYRSVHSIEDAADLLFHCGSCEILNCPPIRHVERFNAMGVCSPGFDGNNYISIYWGTDESNPGDAKVTRHLTDDEIEELNLSLDSLNDCEAIA